MSAIASPYQSFSWTRGLLNWHREQWDQSRTSVEVVIAVAKIFFSTVASIPFMLMDAIFTARHWCCSRPSAPAIASPPAVLQPAAIQEMRTLDPGYIQSVLANPYPFSPILGADTFLSHALEAALRQNPPERVALYIGALREQRHWAENRTAPTVIHKWAAGCLIAHYLNAKAHQCEVNHIYPHWRRGHAPVEPFRIRDFNAEPPVDEHEQGMRLLLQDYEPLTSENRAAALLQIMAPSTQWRLSLTAQYMANRINARAEQMTQDPLFREFFTTVARRI